MALKIAASWLCLLLSSVLANGHQEFAAAAKHASLKRSTYGLEPSRELQRLVYYHESDDREMVASIVLKPNMPMMIHEDFDHYIARITCDTDKMRVSFFDDEILDRATSVWSREPFVMITREPECLLQAHEHAAWIVTYDSVDTDEYLVTLNATKVDLKDVTERMFVDLGEHLASHVDRQALKRRQVVTSTSTTAVRTVISLVSSLTTPSFRSLSSSPSSSTTSYRPSSIYSSSTTSRYSSSSSSSSSISTFAPAASATQTSTTGDVSFAHRNLVILPPDNSIAAAVLPATLKNLKLTCLTCTMNGQVSLTAMNFTIRSNQYLTVEDFLDDGGIQFTTTNFATNMSLELQLLSGWRASAGLASLPSKTLGSIGIAGVITFSPVMDFSIPIAITLNNPVTMRAGFTVPQFPRGVANMNIGSPSKSSATGFNSTVLALPFTADAPNLSFNVSIAMQPRLRLMMGLTSSAKNNLGTKSAVNGSVGVYFDTPILNAKISALNNVNDQCQPDSSRTNTYVRVESGVQFDYGTFIQFDANLGSASLPSVSKHQNVSAVLWSYPLPSQCLRWSESSKSYDVSTGAASSLRLSVAQLVLAGVMAFVVVSTSLGL